MLCCVCSIFSEIRRNLSYDLLRIKPILAQSFFFAFIASSLLRMPVVKYEQKKEHQLRQYNSLSMGYRAQVIRDCLFHFNFIPVCTCMFQTPSSSDRSELLSDSLSKLLDQDNTVHVLILAHPYFCASSETNARLHYTALHLSNVVQCSAIECGFLTMILAETGEN